MGTCTSCTMEQEYYDDEPVAYSGPTILEMLNADCWRLVLDYLLINEVVRSSRVSRAWYCMVLEYLHGVRNFQLDCSHDYNNWQTYVDYQIVRLRRRDMLFFEEMIQKIGPDVVNMVSICINKKKLQAVIMNCPRLEALWTEDARLDECIPRTDMFQQMAMIRNSYLTGSILSRLRTQLKCLALNHCDTFLMLHIQNAMKSWIGLRRLELNYNSTEALENLHKLLVEVPNLEYLSLIGCSERWEDLGDEVLGAIGRLDRLRELDLYANYAVTDKWLKAVARGCPALVSINVGHCFRVTARGVVSLCQARPTLTELVVAGLDLTDSDLEACARYCGGLRLLDASECQDLTSSLLARLAWPRDYPLKLRLYGTMIDMIQPDYRGLILHWDVLLLPTAASKDFPTATMCNM